MSRDFDWDPRKAASNVVDHDVTFREATAVFLDPRCVVADTTRDVDGEARTKAIGMIDGRLFTVVFTVRGHVTRLISARRANRKEEQLYGYGSLHA